LARKVKKAVIRRVQRIMSAIEMRSSFDTKYFCLSVFFVITDIVSSKKLLLQLIRTVTHNTLEAVEIIMKMTEINCEAYHKSIILLSVCVYTAVFLFLSCPKPVVGHPEHI
jgi:hypothetical protein